jgi:hypothetical protein
MKLVYDGTEVYFQDGKGDVIADDCSARIQPPSQGYVYEVEWLLYEGGVNERQIKREYLARSIKHLLQKMERSEEFHEVAELTREAPDDVEY